MVGLLGAALLTKNGASGRNHNLMREYDRAAKRSERQCRQLGIVRAPRIDPPSPEPEGVAGGQGR
jgi:hypothetical protein